MCRLIDGHNIITIDICHDIILIDTVHYIYLNIKSCQHYVNKIELK